MVEKAEGERGWGVGVREGANDEQMARDIISEAMKNDKGREVARRPDEERLNKKGASGDCSKGPRR
ncbi:predicted protein [Histoplasma capsulatum G186AR]|uniref:Uncharacterized protein n=1 Tax=Ajellomyces capsulatus (strain G186AR / H82 / ATCC MYA-2454 / RMSCC 2432) TaxID=447093 RepID=C0NX83_AJECG|nr:uncharacterized protein HCBG_08075 [Histoplasma capsulatum G186AR]EEH03949.1 predicted protein [Histoplasma capsulatum G186AR]